MKCNIDFPNTMDDVYENTDEFKWSRKRKILIVFVDILTNKKFQAMIKELFIRCRKLNISFVFNTQSYFSVLKDVRLNLTHYLIMKFDYENQQQERITKYCN